MHKKGISLFSVELFFVSVPKKIGGEPFCVSKKFWYRKFPCIVGGGSITDLESVTVSSKIFCLTVPKNFVGEPFCVSENFCVEKKLWIRGGGGYHVFPSEIFCLTVPKNIVGEPFGVLEMFWYQNFFWIIGVSGFCRIFLSHSAEKLHGGTLRCLRNVLVSKFF